MFLPDFHSDIPTGNQLLAEIGLDPQTIRETIEDDRAMRCPDRGVSFPEGRFGRVRTSSRPCRPARQPGVRGGLEKSERRGSGE